MVVVGAGIHHRQVLGNLPFCNLLEAGWELGGLVFGRSFWSFGLGFYFLSCFVFVYIFV